MRKALSLLVCSMLVAGAMALSALPGVAAPDQIQMTLARVYMASSLGAAETLGDLQFGKDAAAFTKLAGHMDLEVAGVMPDNSEHAGAVVFRITNADAYLAQNMKDNSLCQWHSAKWLTVRPVEHSANKAVLVSLFYGQDIRDAGQRELCRQSIYTPRPPNNGQSWARSDFFLFNPTNR